MEVHHHSHTPDPGSHRGRKKWTHYFWEFLMLFLAVFCGFLAELQLEHKIEHRRERQYMKTFIADMESDTSQINTWLPMLEDVSKGLDSLMLSLKAPNAINDPEIIYRYAGFPREDIQFQPRDRTMQQLIGSGNMRLIRNVLVSDTLMRYDHFLQYASQKYRLMSASRFEVLNLMDEIFDEREIINKYPVSGSTQPVSENSLALLTKDRYKLDVLFNKLSRLKDDEEEYAHALRFIKFLATKVVDLLKREYHLE